MITLTIIGVIAALTIPNLIQAWKKHQVESGVKEAYSILSNAIKMSETENGRTMDWNYALSTSDFSETYIYPYLQIGQKKITTSSNKFYKKLNNTTPGNAAYNYPSVESVADLKNGMTLGIGSSPGSSTCYGIAVFYADIDGQGKGSNILGKDIFAFQLTPQLAQACGKGEREALLLPGVYGGCHCYDLVFYSASINVFMSSSRAGGCNMNSGDGTGLPQGVQCSAAIAKNGWKIPDDYPVKKF